LSVYRISNLAREKCIKVLLGGTAADDIFSGYRRHQALVYNKWMNMVPSAAMNSLKKYTQSLESHKPFNRRLKKIMQEYGKSDVDRLSGYFSWIPLNVNKSLFNKEVYREIELFEPGSYLKSLLQHIPDEKNELNRLLYLEMKSFLVDHNLNYTDKMSMAVGVEARVPYLDLDLVNFSTQIPAGIKMKGLRTKYLLRKIAENYLPKEVIHRKKSGFGAPVRSWIVNDMKSYIHDRLSPERMKQRGIFNPDSFWKMEKDNREGRLDASYTIWSMLAIESWMTQFVDRK
jgi:asparagine synthase (glutamine-hydrolysing)